MKQRKNIILLAFSVICLGLLLNACGLISEKSTLSLSQGANNTLTFTWHGEDTKKLGDIGLGFLKGTDFNVDATILSDTFSKTPLDLVITCKPTSQAIKIPTQNFTCTNSLNSDSKTISIPTNAVLSLGQTSKIATKNIINIPLMTLQYKKSLNKFISIAY